MSPNFDSFGNYGRPRRTRRGGTPAGLSLLTNSEQRDAVRFGVVGGEAAERVDTREQGAMREVLGEMRVDSPLVEKGRNAGRVKPEYEQLAKATTPGDRAAAQDKVRGIEDAARRKADDAMMKALRSDRARLREVRKFHDDALKAFKKENGLDFQPDGNGGEADFGELAGKVAELEKRAGETVGVIKGALTPGVAAGDPTPEAIVARGELEPTRKRYQQTIEKYQRIKEQRDRADAAFGEVNGTYAKELARRYGIVDEQDGPAGGDVPLIEIPTGVNDALAPAEIVRLHGRMKEIDETIADGRGNLAPRVLSGLQKKRDDIMQVASSAFAYLPDELKQRVIDATRDPTTWEQIKAAGANVLKGAGSAATDAIEFGARQLTRFADATSIANAYGVKTHEDTRKFVKEFADEMRDTADAWGPNVPDEVKQKMDEGFWTGDVPQGLGSTLTFIAPGAVTARLGKAIGLSEAAIKALVTGSVAATGAAGSGNSLRREAEAGLRERFEAGEIDETEYNRALNTAEAFGALLGTSEAIPVANFAKRIGGTPAGRTLLRGLAEAMTRGGKKAATEFVEKNGRAMMKRAADVLGETFEEAVQEYGQSIGEEAFAQGRFGNEGWKAEGDLVTDDSLRGAGAGGVSGMLFSLATNALDGSRRARRLREIRNARAKRNDSRGGGEAEQFGAEREGPPPASPSKPDAEPQNIPENIPAEPEADDELADVLRPRAERITAPAASQSPAAPLVGDKIDEEWSAFAPESQSLGIPRAEMPQVKAEARGALTNFLKARGIESAEEEVLPSALKPTQAEFSPAKVENARKFEGGDRAILVSSDGHVVDGHHQWMAKLTDNPTQPMRVIKLGAPIREVLASVKEFPSAEQAGGSPKAPTARSPIPQEEQTEVVALELLKKGNVTPLVDFRVGKTDAGKWTYTFQLNTNETGYGTPWTGEFSSRDEAVSAGVADAQGWLSRQVNSSRNGSAAFRETLARVQASIDRVRGEPQAESSDKTPKAQVTKGESSNGKPNTPARFLAAVTKAGGIKPSDKAGKFLADFSRRLHKAAPEAFEGMQVQTLSLAEWKASPALSMLTPDSSAAFDVNTNTLYLNSDRLNGDNIASAIVHEGGHFAEKFYLGEEFTQGEWEKLDIQQRIAAAEQYRGTKMSQQDVRDYGAGFDDKRGRREWVAMQFARVVRGDTEGMSAKIKAKLEQMLRDIRELVNKWVGDGKLTTPELDAKILEMLGYADAKKPSTNGKRGSDETDGAIDLQVSPHKNLTGFDAPALEVSVTEANGEFSVKVEGNPDGRGAYLRSELASIAKAKYSSKGDALRAAYEKIRAALDNLPKESRGKDWPRVSDAVNERLASLKAPTAQGRNPSKDVAPKPSTKPTKKAAPIISEDAKKKLGEAFDGLLGTPSDGPQLVDARPPLFSVTSRDRGEYELSVPAYGITGTLRRDGARWVVDAFRVDSPSAIEGYVGTQVVGRSLQMEAVGKALVQLNQKHGLTSRAAPDDGLAGTPAEITQEGVEPERIGKFVVAAQAMIASGVRTPEAMAAVLDSNLGVGARKYSQALWNAFGMVEPSLTSRPDWTAIYSASEKQEPAPGERQEPAPDRPARNNRSSGEDAGQKEAQSEPEGEPEIQTSRKAIAVARRNIKDLLKRAKKIATANPAKAKPLFDRVAAMQEQLTKMEAARKGGATPKVGMSPNGEPDILSDIAEHVGRIRTKKPKHGGGEYDGWAETLNRGAARMLRGGENGMPPDEALGIINESTGRKLASMSDFQDAVTRAVADRERVGRAMKLEEYRMGVEAAALNNEGRGVTQKPSSGLPIEEIGVGAKFKIRGEKFSVVDVDEGPNGTMLFVIQDGHKFMVPEGTLFYPDRGTLEQPAPVDDTEFEDPFALDDKSQSKSEAKPTPPDDLFAPEDMPFNLGSEEQPDGERLLAERIDREQAQRDQDKAQTRIPETETKNEPSPDINLERDRAGAEAGDQGGNDGVRADAQPNGRDGRPVGERAPEQGGARPAAGDAAVAGADGDSALPGFEPGAIPPSASPRGREQRGGSGGAGGSGILDAAGADTAADSVAPDRTGGDDDARSRDRSLQERVSAQRAAERVEVVDADLDNIKATLPVLLPDQHADVLKAERRLLVEQPRDDDPKRGILFTNGTGTGKTFTGLGIIKRYQRRGKKSILIVVPSFKKAIDWRRDGALLSVPIDVLESTKDAGSDTVVTTYANFRLNDALQKRDFDLVVYDESHKLMENEAGEGTSGFFTHHAITNHPDAIRQKVEERIVGPMPRKQDYSGEGFEYANRPDFEQDLQQWYRKRDAKRAEIAAEEARLRDMTKVVFLSATPFAYHKTLRYADGYLFQSPKSEGGRGYNEAGGFDSFLVSNFGYRMRYNKLTQPESGVDMDLMERAFTDRMIKSGAISGRAIDVPFDYSREFVLVDAGLGADLDRGMGILFGWIDRDQNKWNHIGEIARQRFRYHYVQQLMEAIKAMQAVGRIRQHIALGRKAIVFHSYVNSMPFHPFRGLSDLAASPEAKKEVEEFESRYPDLLSLDVGDIVNPLRLLEREFGDAVVFYNGTVSEKKREQNVNAFNDDNSPVKVLVGQVQSIKEGVSLHDTTGKHVRVGVHLELPIRPTDATQEEGRGYRIGQASDAVHEYVVIHTNAEKYAFGSKINERVRTAENLALGSAARALGLTFKQGYLNPISADPSKDQGRGGKEKDRRESVMSPFDQAKSFFFARQKKTSKNKSAEGIDYFATPEPLGMKMTEWLGAQPDEHLLEPSGGHGAIARFFPNFTTNHFVEPSVDLANELRIKVEKGTTHIQRFEDFNVVNKFHGVAMNPPFGTGGKTAIEHLAKAVKHLHDGGRVVALIPEGPSADKRFDAWYENAGKNIIKVAEFGLPTITFERAGTSVKTRIVVIDRIDNDELRTSGQAQGRIDIAAESFAELFDRIEDLGVPARKLPPVQANPFSGRDTILPEQPAGAKAGDLAPAQFDHTKTGQPVHVARITRSLGDDQYRHAKQLATKHGGYYSSYKKAPAVPGFHFPTAAKRDAFIAEYDGSGLHGTPPDMASGETVDAPSLEPPKNAPVPGQPGHRYRSHPDSLILAGIETARQIYKTRGNNADDATAKEIIKAIGETAAAELSTDPNADIPGAVKTAVAVNLQHALNKRRFDKSLSAEERRVAQRMSDRLAQAKAEQFTDMGQSLQFLARLNDYGPDGVLMAAQRNAKQRRERTIGEPGKKAVDDAADAMNAENEKAIDEATADLDRALRAVRVGKSIWQRYQDMAGRRWLKRIESALNGAPETPPMMEFTNRLIREVQARIDEALPPGERHPQRTPAEIIREAVDNRTKYAQAWENAREAIEKQYSDQPDVLEKLDEAMLGLLNQPFSDKTLDRAIKEAHKEMGVSVRDIARMHYKRVDALGKALAEKLVEQTGLKADDAGRLEALVRQRMARITADAKRRALEKLARGKTGGAARVMSTADRIVELSNIGALSKEEYFDAVAQKLKLPGLTEETAAKLRDLAEKAQSTPEGFQRDRVMTDLLTELQKVRGVGIVDVATAVYYAHILSGYTTQAVNAVSTTLNTLADLAALVARHPTTAAQAIRGLRDGAQNGFYQSLAILKTGYSHRHFDEKLPEVSPVLEMLAKDGDRNFALRNYAKLLRYVSRGMKAVDAVFFYSASEAYQRVAAARMAAQMEDGKLSWRERAEKVRTLLGMSPNEFEAARQQAKREGLSGLDYQLRVGEIIRQKRDASLVQAGTDFGRMATFNNEPRGYLGVAAKAIRDASTKFPPLRLFVPFTNIVSNVSNASLNYSPIGIYRAFGGYGGETAPQAEERDSLLIKGIAGTIGMIYLLAYGLGDDDEPWITGQGPKDNNARNQLRETGWKPHTVKIGGAYVSYLETPLAIPLAIVGNYIDGLKYNGMAEEDAATRLGKALASAPETMVSMSFLRGLADFMDAARGRKNWGEVAGSVVAGITVPNLVRQIDRTFDPTIYETDGALGVVAGQIPGVRQMFPERLTVTGKPIEVRPLERFGRSDTEDELWQVLASKQAWIPEPGRSTKLGNAKMTSEQYRELIQRSGPAIERRLRAALPQLRNMSAEQADKFVEKVTDEERQKAKAQIRRPFVNPFPR